MLGICVGVAALITIISVMNGLEGEPRTRLLSLTSHATISGQPGAHARLASCWPTHPQAAGRGGRAPYLDLQGMLGRGEDLRAAMIRGIEPQIEPQVSDDRRAHDVGLARTICNPASGTSCSARVSRTRSTRASATRSPCSCR